MLRIPIFRLWVAALLGLALTAGGLVAARPAEAADLPLSRATVISNNLQGGTAGADSKWTTTVTGQIRFADVVLLQEVGSSGPPSGRPQTPIIVNPGGRGSVTIEHSTWMPRDIPYNVYFLRTSNGGRVNSAIVTRDVPDEVNVVENPIPDGRAALGVRFGNHWYFTFHGQSGSGGDSGALLGAVNTQVAQWSNGRAVWTVGGDFNVEPGVLPNRSGYPSGVARIHNSGLPTHQSGSELDYFVTNDLVTDTPTTRLPGGQPDHYPVNLGGLRAAALPPVARIRPTVPDIDNVRSGITDVFKGLGVGVLAFFAITSLKRDVPVDFVGSHHTSDGVAYDTFDHAPADAGGANIVLLQPSAATLDLNDTDKAIAGIRSRVNALQVNPDVVVILGGVLPASGTDPGQIKRFNSALRDLSIQMAGNKRRVVLADTSTITAGDVTADGSLTDAGRADLSRAYSEAVVSALVLGWVEDIDEIPGKEKAKVRLMPAGDSITAGFQSSDNNGYRGTLYTDLGKSPLVDASSLEFVGSMRSGNMADPDHEGHSGWLIAEIGQALRDAVPAYRPNVVTLMAGTNDTDRDHQVSTAPERLGSVIDQILKDSPGVTVLVATIPPNANPAGQARVTAYNREVTTLVSSRAATGAKVNLVNMSMLTPGDLSDGLHPNDTGYQKIGHAFAAAVNGAIRAGQISSRDDGGQQCTDTPGRWIDRGQIASGIAARYTEEYVFADLDGDGRADYLLADRATGAVRAWMNRGGDQDGRAGWEPRGQVASGIASKDERLVFADLDGDRRADYLLINYETGAVRAWMNRGGDQDGKPGWDPRGQVASGTLTSPLSEWVVFADVNGDGRADYLVADRKSGAVQAWMNIGGDQDGKPGWNPVGQIAAGTGGDGYDVSGPYFANVDCDKRADYLIVHSRSWPSPVTAWLNRGGDQNGKSGWIPRGQIAAGIPLGHSEYSVFADIDGDGRADYLVVDRGTGAVKAWINNGGDPS
ncbi:GDSL-type esterase/lipase family protein [Streptomyces sp. NPDC087440]|uniref:GDSL-type esterase/lipase family protein n=1 Tax=Streptomyces sp. NPDC087440 TaxID=3365790 RepID=UPI00381014B0